MLTIPTLPQETLEEIVDFLHDDRRALLACSLASTRCLPVSRYHLFSEVKLVSTKLCRFLELLDSPWSSIANTISRIVFTGYDRSQKFPCQWMQRRARSMGLESGTLVEYLPHFPRIRGRLQSVAAIRFADLSTVDIPETMWRVLAVIKSVKTLEMHRVAFEECPLRFLGYLSSLPLLETLSISRPTMLMNPAQLTLLQERIGGGEDCCIRLTKREVGTLFRVPLLDIRRSSQIPSQNQNLSRSAAAGIALLEWLVAQWPMPAIVSLRMNLDSEPRMVSMLTRYFECAGSSIQALCVTLPSSFPALRNMADIDFGPLTHIRWLHIDGLFLTHSTSTRLLEAFFRGFLAQLFCSSSSSSAVVHEVTTTMPPIPPSIEKISITLTIDAKVDYSYYGVPDYAILRPFTWCSLPSVIDEALEPLPEKLKTVEVQLQVRSAGIEGAQVGFAEECIRAGAWKRFSDSGRLRVAFLPLAEKDGDLDVV